MATAGRARLDARVQPSVVLVAVDVLFAVVSATSARRLFRRRIGRNPWGVHPALWLGVGFILGPIGACLALLACVDHAGRTGGCGGRRPPPPTPNPGAPGPSERGRAGAAGRLVPGPVGSPRVPLLHRARTGRPTWSTTAPTRPSRCRPAPGLSGSRPPLSERRAVALHVDRDGRALGVATREQVEGQAVLDLLLDDPTQRPGPEVRVVAGVGQPGLGGRGDASARAAGRRGASAAGRAGCRRSPSGRPRSGPGTARSRRCG